MTAQCQANKQQPIDIQYVNWLVVLTILKNMKVGWDDYSQYMEK